MTLPMKQKEFDKWGQIRAKGRISYGIKTSVTALIVTFLIYFLGNAYVNLGHLDQYIAYNIGIADTLGLTLLISFVALFIFSIILYSVNDKRYIETQSKGISK